jgi:3-hydroxybutyryl-CoA dehydrogenase
MMTEELRHVCVVGAGTMGRGIAQVALKAGHAVTLVDPSSSQLDHAEADIIARLRKTAPDAAAGAVTRLHTVQSIAESIDRNDTTVIEAVVEDLELKHDVLNAAHKHFGPACILATNTSSLSVTEIAAGVPDPSRVVGMHFFNPVPVMKLIEVVDGLQSDPAVVEQVAGLASSWGKRVVRVHSTPGFIVNRVARSFYGEALRLLEERAASVETIDEVIRGAGQFRMGPFELMDLIGLEVNLAVTRTVWRAYNNDPRFAPSLIQLELVAAGRLGRKSGHGFYRYDAGTKVMDSRPTMSQTDATLPATLELHGTSPQLEGFVHRSDQEHVSFAGTATPPRLVVPAAGAVIITRGRTAQEETQTMGMPVAVLDRCIDPTSTTSIAFATRDDTLAAALTTLLQRAGIEAIRIADTPGLVVARILSMIANEAWETAHHGVATPQDIDAAMVLGTNYPCGPFEWSSSWGEAHVLEVLDALSDEYRDPRYRASQRLRAQARLQDAG